MKDFVVLAVLFLTATCVVAQGQSTNTTRSKTGAITGTVVTESGQPLENVVIWVRTYSSSQPVQMALTDHEGKFEVNGLEPLSYQILTRHSVYNLQPRDDGTPNNYHIGDSVKFVMVKGGVITGTVTTRTGEPVIGVRVRVIRVPNGDTFKERTTDDRGFYRVYGLPAGKYVLAAGGDGGAFSVDPYAGDVMTYSPASTRDTAAEINVREGEEIANVDIRYRGDPGRTVSGTVSDASGGLTEAYVSLIFSGESGSQSNAGSYPLGDNRGFVFYGVDDGDYTIIARKVDEEGEWSFSLPKPVSVRGADVTGVGLSLKPLGSVSGQVVLEELKTKECGKTETPVLTETLVSAWHKQNEAAKAQPAFVWNLGTPVSADAQGSLKLRNLAPSDYYFVTRFEAKSWYLKSISLTSSTTKKTVDATRVWTTVKHGDRISGLKIILAQGAASLSGHAESAEGEALPDKLFVYLVPSEKESTDDVLRFYGAPVNLDGTLSMNNLAPGRYWLLARPALDGGLTKLRVPDATEARRNLRLEAEAGKLEVELKPCQQVVDYRLRFSRR